MSKFKEQWETITPGLYRAHDNPDYYFLHAGEILKDQGLPDCQENRLAVFQLADKLAQSEGKGVILLQEDGVKSLIEALTEALEQQEQ